MAEEEMRAMHQQFTTALEGLARQNTELQNELNQRRQQAANELAALLFFSFSLGGGGQRDASVFGRSRHESFRVCKVNLVTLKVAVKK